MGKVQHPRGLASLEFLKNKCKWILVVKIKVLHFLWPDYLSIPKQKWTMISFIFSSQDLAFTLKMTFLPVHVLYTS